jgi:low temperature requirement protein LtrA
MTTSMRPLRLRYVAGINPERKVTWLELFFDLVFVAAVAQAGQPLRDDLSAAGVVRYALLFALIWWAWIGESVFATRFTSDDGLQRGLTLVQMFAVATMAANADEALDSRSSAGFAAAYAVLRCVLVTQYARARRIAAAKALATNYLIGHGAAAVLWLVSALVPAPLRFALWGVALAIDLGTPWMAARHNVQVPPDAAHLPERFGLFTLILLGESVVAVMRGMKGQADWSVPAATAAFLGMATAFLLWWWYFDGAAAASDRLIRSRRDVTRFHVWSYAHLPLYVGIAVAFAGIEHIVEEGATAALHGGAGLMMSAGSGGAMLALTAIGAARSELSPRPSVLILQSSIAALTVCCGLVATRIPALFVVVTLAGLCAMQLKVALASRIRSTVQHMAAS